MYSYTDKYQSTAERKAVEQLIADLTFIDTVLTFALARDQQLTLSGRIEHNSLSSMTNSVILKALKLTPASVFIQTAGELPVSLQHYSFKHTEHLLGITMLRIY